MNSLCVVVKDCKNFKVRINAATALSSPKERCQYGDSDLYCRVWRGVIEAFATAEDIADYIDFRYRDTLTDQVCIHDIFISPDHKPRSLKPSGCSINSSTYW